MTVRRGTAGVDLELPVGHPCHPALVELKVKELQGIYEEQKRLIDRLDEVTKTDVFVAQYTAPRRDDDGTFSSYTVWSKGIEQTIPQTEQVAFYNDELSDDQKICANLDWRTVQRHFGHLLESTGDVPPRYRTRGFPEADALAGLARGGNGS